MFSWVDYKKVDNLGGLAKFLNCNLHSVLAGQMWAIIKPISYQDLS